MIAMLIFVVGTLIGLLAGGLLCGYCLRSTITGDIGPQLRRMHADIDPQLRRMQNQLDLIESAVNLAMATWYAEMSTNLPRPHAIPAPRPNDEGQR
jgi:hypothetical protein